MRPRTSHRYRICGTPSRLGCLTCKIRRVKCGEEKPFCKRCTSTGRKCDGYGPPTSRSDTPSKSLLNSASSSLVGENAEDPRETKFHYFFHTVTAPLLSGNFSTDFWERRVLQSSITAPSVRHAVIAIAAIHHDFNARNQDQGIGYDPSLQAFAFGQYTKAISSLHQLMSTRSQELDITLISCILFICIDCLLGNHASAIVHLEAGLRILRDIKTPQEPRGASALEWEKEFAPPLLSLGVQAATFVNPKLQQERTALWGSLKGAGMGQQPENFDSLDIARHALDTITADIMYDRTSQDSILQHTPPNPDGPQGRAHNAKLLTWTNALERHIDSLGSVDATNLRIRRGADLLKVHALVISVVIGLPNEADEKFEKILGLCEFLLSSDANGPMPTTYIHFSTDQGVIAPLFFTALRAPKPSTKQRALNILGRAPGREGMWDAEEAIRVAVNTLKDMEQSMGARSSIPSSATPHTEAKLWNDIADRLKNRMVWPFGAGEPTSPLQAEFPIDTTILGFQHVEEFKNTFGPSPLPEADEK